MLEVIYILILHCCVVYVQGLLRNNTFKTFENNPDYQQSLLINSFLKYSNELFSKDEKRGISEGKLNHDKTNSAMLDAKNTQSSIYTTNFDMDETKSHHSLESSLVSWDSIPRYNVIGHYIVPRKIMLDNGDYVYKVEVPSLNLTEDKIKELVENIKNYEKMENFKQQRANLKRSVVNTHSEVRRCERRKKEKKKEYKSGLNEREALLRHIVLNLVDRHLANNPNLDMASHPLLHKRKTENVLNKLIKRGLKKRKMRRFQNSFRLTRNQLPFICPKFRKQFETTRSSVNVGKKGNCCLPAGMHKCSSIRPCDCAYTTELLPPVTTCPPVKMPPMSPPPPSRCPSYEFTPQPCPTTENCHQTTQTTAKLDKCPVTVCSRKMDMPKRNRKIKRRRIRKRKRLQH